MRLRLVALAALLGGCSSPLTEARTSFDEGRFPDAAAELRRLAPGELSGRELFQYALYRGLTHLALGDAALAGRWLCIAKRIWEQSHAVATDDEQGRLAAAWRSMGLMPGD